MGKAETAGSLIFQNRHPSFLGFFYCIVYFEKAYDENLMTSNTATMYGKQLGIFRTCVLCSVATNMSREGVNVPLSPLVFFI